MEHLRTPGISSSLPDRGFRVTHTPTRDQQASGEDSKPDETRVIMDSREAISEWRSDRQSSKMSHGQASSTFSGASEGGRNGRHSDQGEEGDGESEFKRVRLTDLQPVGSTE